MADRYSRQEIFLPSLSRYSLRLLYFSEMGRFLTSVVGSFVKTNTHKKIKSTNGVTKEVT